jgi:hypothetical protein
MTKITLKSVLWGLITSLLTACGGGGTGAVTTGQFINSPAKGVSYRTSSGLSGVTDANGNFEFRAGDSVSFSLDLGNGNSLSLGSATGGTAVSVLSLSGSSIDPLAVSQVLQTLDQSSVSGSMDLTGLVLPSNVVQNIQSALASSAAANAVIGTIATSVHTALPNREQKNPEGVTTLEALSTLAQQPANQSAVRTRIKQGVSDGLLYQVEDKPAFGIHTITADGVSRTQLEFMLLDNTGVGQGEYFMDSQIDVDTNPNNRKRSGTYTYSANSSTGDWTNWDNDGGGQFIVRGVDLPHRQFVLEYKNNAYQETGSIAGKFLLAMQTSGLVGKKLKVRKACNDGSDAVLTFNNAAEANGFDVAFTSNCLSSGFFKPLTSPAVFNGYVLEVTGGTKIRRIGLLDHRNSTKARSDNFGVDPAGGSGRFVVLPENRDDRDEKPQFFDFSYESR